MRSPRGRALPLHPTRGEPLDPHNKKARCCKWQSIIAQFQTSAGRMGRPLLPRFLISRARKSEMSGWAKRSTDSAERRESKQPEYVFRKELLRASKIPLSCLTVWSYTRRATTPEQGRRSRLHFRESAHRKSRSGSLRATSRRTSQAKVTGLCMPFIQIRRTTTHMLIFW